MPTASPIATALLAAAASLFLLNGPAAAPASRLVAPGLRADVHTPELAAGRRRQEAGSLQLEAGSGQREAGSRQREAGGKREAGSGKREAFNGKRAAASVQTAAAAAPVSSYRIVKIYPHDPTAFTQGLVYLDGALYEGTGQNGQSGIRKVRLENGEVLQQQKLDPKYFGEGIAVWGKSIIQITWQSEVGFVYDLTTFKQTRTFSYKGEGWGLTHDGKRLIMSDGSSSLRYLDPATLRETGRLTVRDGATPIDKLNELEFVKGEILANVWQTNRLARISRTGQVVGWIDLAGLLDPRDARNVDVLNGIAYDAAADRLFVTGKWWPKLFEIVIVPPAAPAARSGR